MVNKKLFRRIKKHILEDPRRMSMVDWIQRKSLDYDDVMDYEGSKCSEHVYPPCGTAGCIAGWAVMLTDGIDEATAVKSYGSCSMRAYELLGITEKEGDALFHIGMWPPNIFKAYMHARTPAGKARAAVRAIDAFLTKPETFKKEEDFGL